MPAMSNAERLFRDKIEQQLGGSLPINYQIVATANGFRVQQAPGAAKVNRQIVDAFNAVLANNDAYRLRRLLSSKIISHDNFSGSAWNKLNPQEKTLIGQISDAKGRYFEYLVFTKLESLWTNAGGTVVQDSNYSKMKSQEKAGTTIASNIAKLSSVSLKYNNIDAELNQAIEKAAEIAVQQYWKSIPDPKEKYVAEHALMAVAGSEKAGDIKVGNIMLELKFSSNRYNVKYFTLNDKANFGRSLLGWIKENQGLAGEATWKDKNNEHILPTNTWLGAVRTLGFNAYWEHYLKETVVKSSETVDYLRYFLNKGKISPTVDKKIVSGMSIQGEDQVIIVDADELLNQLTKKSLEINSTTTSDRVTFTSSLGNVAYLTTEAESFARYSWDNLSKAEREKSAEDKTGTFLFYLQKGFFS